MSETKKLAEQLQRATTAAEIQTVISAVSSRRKMLKERLFSIEDRNGAARRAVIDSGDIDALSRLNAEAELLDDECGMLSEIESRAVKLHVPAAEKESIEAGRRAHKNIGSLIGAAEKALLSYSAARKQLESAISAIREANDLRPPEERSYLNDAAIARVLDVMWPASLVSDDRRGGALSGIKRCCSPSPGPIYSEPAPDFFEQIRSKMFGSRE